MVREELNTPTDARTGAIAGSILAAFESYHAEFQGMTRRARGRFARSEWVAARRDAAERLGLYGARVGRTVNAVLAAVESDAPADSPALWRAVKECFAQRAAARPDGELAETFYNSVVRRARGTTGIDAASEFTDGGPADRLPNPTRLHRLDGPPTADTLRRALLTFDLGTPWVALDDDVRLGIDALDTQLVEAGVGAVDATELLPAAFYRNKGAYLVGRMWSGGRSVPLLLPLVRGAEGVMLDAVLTATDEVSVVFGFTRSYFHAELPHPRAAIGFLRTIVPHKRLDELYTAIGYNKHGKTELYRDLVRQLEAGARFEPSEGDRGMVMAVFALPALNVVFKVIKDRFEYPKRTTRAHVMEKYDLVFGHDRVGRLADAQEFVDLVFHRDHFVPALLEELLRVAGNTVILEGDRVRLAHAYTERRVTPLNLFLRSASAEAGCDAVVDYGNAIKDLAAANIFPGDMLLKNFGVTRHGRVIFYDYDELTLLTDCTFRRIPPPLDEADEVAAEPWFHVGERDVFPEEFRNFVTLPGVLGEAFSAEHADLFDIAFWQAMQRRQQEGEVVDFFPYRPARRLRAR